MALQVLGSRSTARFRPRFFCFLPSLPFHITGSFERGTMPSRRVADHKPQYTPPALFFELEREFKAVARQATSSKSQRARTSKGKGRSRRKRY